MHVVIWILSGFLAGFLARKMVERRGAGWGVPGDVVLGLLGGLVGGWLVRQLGFTGIDSTADHAFVALVGALLLLGGKRLLFRAWLRARKLSRNAGPLSLAELEAHVARLNLKNIDPRVVAKNLLGQPTPGNVNDAFEEQLTFGQRVADRVASFGGSWPFIGLFGVVLVLWMIFNTEIAKPFDPYPFILLNLVLSCVAALQAPVIMMSQNRVVAKDRLEQRMDYEVNLRAELQIMALHAKLDDVREREWRAVQEKLDRQSALLATLLGSLEKRTAGPEGPAVEEDSPGEPPEDRVPFP